VSRPFRFGISARYAGSREEWQEKARRAEGCGYSLESFAPVVERLSGT
jgi:hypothetical protein